LTTMAGKVSTLNFSKTLKIRINVAELRMLRVNHIMPANF
jgi:hypothetical protein